MSEEKKPVGRPKKEKHLKMAQFNGKLEKFKLDDLTEEVCIEESYLHLTNVYNKKKKDGKKPEQQRNNSADNRICGYGVGVCAG